MKFKILLIILFLSGISLVKASEWEGLALAEFNLQDQYGIQKNNKTYLGEWLVLYFYPKDKTPGCTIEAQNFTDDYQKYRLLKTNIVGVSYDDVASHKDFAETYEIPFSILSDSEKILSKSLKVDRLFPWPHASRQTFIIDPMGFIVKHYADVSPETHSSQLLNDLKLLQKTTLVDSESNQ